MKDNQSNCFVCRDVQDFSVKIFINILLEILIVITVTLTTTNHRHLHSHPVSLHRISFLQWGFQGWTLSTLQTSTAIICGKKTICCDQIFKYNINKRICLIFLAKKSQDVREGVGGPSIVPHTHFTIQTPNLQTERERELSWSWLVI